MISEQMETWRRIRQAIRGDQPIAPRDVPDARIYVARSTALWRALLPAAAAVLVTANIVLRLSSGSASTQFVVVEVVLLVLCALAVLPWLRVRRWLKRHPLG
jgi:hypothetical protein